MKNKLKRYNEFIAENSTETEVSPVVAPPKPGTRPTTPFRRPKPIVIPRPKAELEDVLDRFDLEATDAEKKYIKTHYEKY